MNPSPKIIRITELASARIRFRKAGQTVVFTNGCFDILHAGHVRYLETAKSLGDILIVGLNSDESVKMIKGDKRPIVEQTQRAEVIAGLGCVDYVTVFNQSDPLRIIQRLKPDILVKGEDWEEKDIIGADFVKKNGGKIVRVSEVPGASTSSIIQRIVQRYQKDRFIDSEQ